MQHPRRQCILNSFALFILVLVTAFFTAGFLTHKPLLGPLFLASVIPSAFILYIAYRDDAKTTGRYSTGVCTSLPPTHSDKIPFEILLIAVSMGILITLPVGTLNGYSSKFLQRLGHAFGGVSFFGMVVFAFIHAYILVAMIEEGSKYLCAQYSIQEDEYLPYITHPYGVVLFGLGAALGFAGLENVTYVVSEDSNGKGWILAIVRAVLSVPLHATTGALIGVGLARMKFLKQKLSVARILLLPVIIHGTYDFIWMLPLRNGKFHGKGDDDDDDKKSSASNPNLQTAHNTLDVGNYIYAFYIFNVLWTMGFIFYAVHQSNKMKGEFLALQEATPRRSKSDDDDGRNIDNGGVVVDIANQNQKQQQPQPQPQRQRQPAGEPYDGPSLDLDDEDDSRTPLLRKNNNGSNSRTTTSTPNGDYSTNNNNASQHQQVYL